MNIFTRTITRELYLSTIRLLVIVLAIMFSILVIRYLGQASSGRIAPSAVFPIMAYAMLNFLPILLLIAVFFGVILVLARQSAFSEVIAWNSAGVALWQWLVPVLWLTVPLSILSAGVAFYWAPWANQQIQIERETFQKRGDLARLSAGRFQESSDGTRVFFVEERENQPGEVQNIFLQLRNPTDASITTVLAQRGSLQQRANAKHLELSAGTQLSGVVGANAYQVVQFEKYEVTLEPDKAEQAAPPLASDSLDSAQLFQQLASNSDFRGEWLRRISHPVMLLLLPILAIALGANNPRSGRGLSLLFALLIYIVYSNLILLAANKVAQGDWYLHPTLFALHGAVALAGIIFLKRRNALRWH